LSKADILISTSTFYWPKLGKHFDRYHDFHAIIMVLLIKGCFMLFILTLFAPTIN